MNYYIADLHLGHKNSLVFDNRPFTSVEEQTQVIIDNWNTVVKNTDDVYILGDFFWCKEIAVGVLQQLKGNKHLILGNHDKVTGVMRTYFKTITSYAEVTDDGRKVVLSHYPIAHWKNADYGTVHLFGHIHNGRDSRPFEQYKQLMLQRGLPYRCYNVGCMIDYMNYTPQTLDSILEKNEQTTV